MLDVGWRERDWARFTDSERRVFYGTGRDGWAADRRSLFKPGVGVAILVSAGIFLLGHFPRHDPLGPGLNFTVPGLKAADRSPRSFPLRLPNTAQSGSVLTLSGSSGSSSGAMTVVGHWNSQPWQTLAVFNSRSDGTWSVPIALNRKGMLNLRVVLPNGDLLTGSVRVTAHAQ